MTAPAPNTLPRLLIFEQRMMGDAIMSLPFIRAAQKHFDVHVACTPGTTHIFNLLLPAGNVHPWHPPWTEASGGSEPAPWSSLRPYLTRLKQLAPDVAVSVWADPRVHYLMTRCGAKRRIGFPISQQNYYAHNLRSRRYQLRIGRIISLAGSLLNGSPQLTDKINRAQRNQHHVDCWKQLAQTLNLPWDESTPWFTPADAPLPDDITRAIAQARHANKKLWIIHAGARIPSQRWPLNYFVEMLRDEIEAHGAQPILIDSPEVQWPADLRTRYPTAHLPTIEQLIALFAKCDALLCNDTGVSHLAASLGKSVVAIFLTSSPYWFAPRGAQCQSIATERAINNPSIGKAGISPISPDILDLRPGVRAAIRSVMEGTPHQTLRVQPRKIRVLLDAHMIGERETGNETYIVNLIRALRNQTDSVDLEVAVAHPEKAVAAIGPAMDSCHYHEVSTSPWRRLIWELPRLAAKTKADLLQVTYAGPLFAPCPIITAVHDVAYAVEPSWFSPRDRRVLAFGINLTVRHAARVITISEHSKKELVERLRVPSERITITLLAAAPLYRRLPNAERAAFNPTSCGISGPFVLAVGNLQPRKNLLRLVEAFARVIKKNPALTHQLVLVGKAQWRESDIQRAIEQHGIADRVVFTGYVSDDDLVALFNRADVFAYPSLYEGFGLPVLEAMACGTPTLTSNVTSIPEVAGDAAELVDPTDIAQIANGLEKMLSNPQYRAELQRRGFEQVTRFSWDKCATQTIDVYRAALRSRT